MNKKVLIFLFILVAAIMRLLPHLPNFTPVASMALFGGAYFNDKRLAYLVPILVMLISDAVLGFSMISVFVYISFLIIAFIGQIYKTVSLTNILLSSLLFFIITNFGVWILGGYAHNFYGLQICYIRALPFLKYSIMGDLFYSGLMWFGFNFILQKYPNKFAQ